MIPHSAALCLLLTISAPAAEIIPELVSFAGTRFTVVRVPAPQVQLVWKDAKGVPFRSFDRVQSTFAQEGKTIRFIMNAGIFEPGGIPSGLHIEKGRTLRPLNLADAPGNFFFKPNGVCTFGSGAIAGPFIGTCEAWQKRTASAAAASPPASEVWGIQSGPMLLINGKRHPAFKQGSISKLHRNGVGIDAANRLVFAITASKSQAVNLWDFAGLFLHLGCQNALFLDGDISQSAINPTAPITSNQFAAMFVVTD